MYFRVGYVLGFLFFLGCLKTDLKFSPAPKNYCKPRSVQEIFISEPERMRERNKTAVFFQCFYYIFICLKDEQSEQVQKKLMLTSISTHPPFERVIDRNNFLKFWI